MHSQMVGMQKLSPSLMLVLSLAIALALVFHMSHPVKISLPDICLDRVRPSRFSNIIGL